MPGTNFNSKINEYVRAEFTNNDAQVTFIECDDNPNIVATESGIYTNGCYARRTDVNVGNSLYVNIGTINSPSWTNIGGGAGATGIPTEIPYFDSIGNVTSDAAFTRNATHETLLS